MQKPTHAQITNVYGLGFRLVERIRLKAQGWVLRACFRTDRVQGFTASSCFLRTEGSEKSFDVKFSARAWTATPYDAVQFHDFCTARVSAITEAIRSWICNQCSNLKFVFVCFARGYVRLDVDLGDLPCTSIYRSASFVLSKGRNPLDSPAKARPGRNLFG